MAGKTYGAVVLAAGSGSRMESDTEKQFMMLDGKPMIYYPLLRFQESPVQSIVLVVPPGREEYCREEIVASYGFDKICDVVPGGSERYFSVYAGLRALKGADYVLIHDGARPCVDSGVIGRIMAAVASHGPCIAAMPVKDTIKVADKENRAVHTPDRRSLWQVQTPQAFPYRLIRDAYEKAIGSEMRGLTDDAQVLERVSGIACRLIEGSYRNIKVTTPEDLEIARLFLQKNG